MVRHFRKFRSLETPDEYIERLQVTVPGMVHKGNVYWFDKIIKELRSTGPILEIGSFCGQSTLIMRYFLDKYGKKNKLVACDPFVYEGWLDKLKAPGDPYLKYVANRPDISRNAYNSFVREAFIRNQQFFSAHDLCRLVQMNSDEFFKNWSAGKTLKDIFGNELKTGNKFSFCFIDGDHNYEAVRRDVENVISWLEPTGKMLMDDSDAGSKLGSARLAAELERDKRVRLIGSNPHCLFQKKEA